MSGLLKGLVVRFVRARWGSILPAVFKAAAEGQFGPGVAKVYWFTAGKKTVVGAAVLFAGAGLETICGSYPTLGWSCAWAHYIYYAGGILFSVGLLDGGVRAPWPNGTVISPEDKK